MPLPPAVRYRWVRLKAISRPLRRPVVWGTLATLGLVTVVVPQYLRHPEWRSQYDAAVDSPAVGPGTDLGALSSEDLSDLAEIDNLAALLDQLQPTTSTVLDSPGVDSASINSDRLALQATAQTTVEGAEGAAASPFAQYLERSRFRFSPAASSEAGSGDLITIEDRFSTFTSGQRQPLSAEPATEALPPNPLQQALNERLNSRSDPGAESPSTTRAGDSSTAEDSTSGLTPPPWMVEGSLPGVDQRFIRTTPQMSPPAGTTGYTQPPGLISTPQGVTPRQSAAPAALNLNFDPVTAPAGDGRVQPASGAIDTRPSAPLPQPAPPFSAPRPPGVYTGNGYINTFSNPSAPAN